MRRSVHLLILIVLLAHAWRLFVIGTAGTPAADLAVYASAAARLERGQDIYGEIYNEEVIRRVYGDGAPDGTWFRMHYFYPPFLAAVARPIAPFTHTNAKQCASAINFVFLVASAFLLAALVPAALTGKGTLLAYANAALLLMSLYDPFYITFAEGQVNLAILFFTLTFLHLWLRSKPFAAGIMLSLPVLIKMSPVTILAGPIRGRHWRIAAGFLSACIAATCLLLFSDIPFDSYSRFFFKFRELAAGSLEDSHAFNFNLSKTVLIPLSLQNTHTARWIIKACIGIAVLAALLRLKPDAAFYPVYSTALMILGMIFLSPTTWAHHLTWVSIPLAALLIRRWDDEKRKLRRLTLFLALTLFLGKAWTLQGFVFLEYPEMLPFVNGILNIALIVPACVLMRDGAFRIARQ